MDDDARRHFSHREREANSTKRRHSIQFTFRSTIWQHVLSYLNRSFDFSLSINKNSCKNPSMNICANKLPKSLETSVLECVMLHREHTHPHEGILSQNMNRMSFSVNIRDVLRETDDARIVIFRRTYIRKVLLVAIQKTYCYKIRTHFLYKRHHIFAIMQTTCPGRHTSALTYVAIFSVAYAHVLAFICMVLLREIFICCASVSTMCVRMFVNVCVCALVTRIVHTTACSCSSLSTT